MNKRSTIRLAGLGLMLPLMLVGCSKDAPVPAATVTATTTASGSPTPETIAASASPTADLTPTVNLSPLGGTPATEEEIDFYNRKKEAQDLTLNKNYDKAIPLLEKLHTEAPTDTEVLFNLLMSYGSLEPAPSKKSKAYTYAEQILSHGAGTREAEKARAYINTANLALPETFKYGTDTMEQRGNWVFAPEDVFQVKADIPWHTNLSSLGPADQVILWDTEASPTTSSAEKLPKGSKVSIVSTRDFFYSLNSWRKILPPKLAEFDPTIFDISAMYVEVVSDGALKGKKGWIVNQADRYLGKPDAEWGVWIDNRIQVPRDADLAETTPKS